MTSADRTPVLVGVGVATQREEDFHRALEPMDLMLQAVQSAGQDTGSNAALAGTQWIAVPRGRWTYTNPAGAIARAVGATQATTVLTSVTGFGFPFTHLGPAHKLGIIGNRWQARCSRPWRCRQP